MTEAERFLELLRRREEKYSEMVAAAEGQKKFLASSDLDGLMALVARKQALMAEIGELEKEIAPVKERWPEVRAGLDPETVRRVEEAVGRTRKVLETLVRLEDEGRALMKDRRASTLEDLKGLMTKKKARGAYGGGAADARFFDGAK